MRYLLCLFTVWTLALNTTSYAQQSGERGSKRTETIFSPKRSYSAAHFTPIRKIILDMDLLGTVRRAP